jgi:protein O-mannosyl-transferase
MRKRKTIIVKPSLSRRKNTLLFPASLQALAAAALLVVITCLVYLPSINGGFLLDDKELITRNDLVRAPDGLFRFWCTTDPLDYWPVTNSAFWIEWRLWGDNPSGYHALNLTLHIVESLLVWIILRKLSFPGAIAAALVFAVHPVNVESVAWISSLKNLLAMLFALLSALWYLRSHGGPWERERRENGGPWDREQDAHRETANRSSHPSSLIPHPSSFYWLSLAAFLLAMLSKGSVATLPLIILAIAWWLRPLGTRDLVRIAPFFAIAAIFVVLNVWFQTHGSQTVIRNADFLDRLLGAGGVVWFYLYKGLWPVDLLFVYPQWHVDAANLLWWLPLLSAFIVTLVLWITIILRHSRDTLARPLLFAWVVFCAALVPAMGFADVGFMKNSLVADRYQHIAIIAPIALAAAAFSVWFGQLRAALRRPAALIVAAAVAVLALLAWRQSSLYRDQITLCRATLQKNPDSWLLHNNLGNAFHAIGREDLAIEQYKLSLQLMDDAPQILNNLGNALDETGNPEQGIEYLKRSLELQPDYPSALYNMGNAMMHIARYDEAIGYYQKALRLKPDYAEPYINSGNALAHLGRFQEAIDQYNRAIKIQSDNALCWYDLALADANLRQSSQAVACAERALDLARAQNNTQVAAQIEKWLDSYRARLTSPAE